MTMPPSHATSNAGKRNEEKRRQDNRKGLELITDSAYLCLSVSLAACSLPLLGNDIQREKGGLHSCGVACLQSGSRQVSVHRLLLLQAMGW